MYICLGCHLLFNAPRQYTEQHGLESPPYEVYYGCPKCGEPYVEAHRCDICGEYIKTEQYVVTKDMRHICSNCYREYNLGDVEI